MGICYQSRMDGKATTETGHKQALSVSQLVELVCELTGTVGELRQSVACRRRDKTDD
jgi:hypothetical protein